MNTKTLKFAVSALAIGSTMVACKPAANALRPASASAAEAKMESGAAASFAKAQAAYQAGKHDEALGLAEEAVSQSPRDLGYRMLLADLYLRNGRFASAEATYDDVLTLEPSNQRAAMSVALSRIALGRTGGAIALLDGMQMAPPADLGLAYALAGEHARALQILEPAARAAGAPARVRQNLALTYALSGDWDKARMLASQDISADQLGARLEHWARIAQPRESWDQVAALLGVTPREDGGQPARLALASPQSTALAAADLPQTVPAALGGPVPEAVPEPVRTAAAPEMPAWVSSTEGPESAAIEEEDTRPVYAAAVESLVTPQPAVMKAAPAFETGETFKRAVPRAAGKKASALKTASEGTGRFAVQLGAFNSPAAVERAWAAAYKRYGFAGRTPLSTTVSVSGGTFHRLSVAGFGSHGEASSVCRGVKTRGGTCFVREVAGDAPVRWAARYAGRDA
jgi:Flp pilus assembly protein TadD/cell division protein FtsN